VEVLISGISRLQLGSLGKKWHLGVGPMVRHREYYKGEGGGFPQVRVLVSLVSSCLFVTRPSTKNALTNLLFNLCRSMWVIDSLVTLPSPYPEPPTRPFYPRSVASQGVCPTFYPYVIFTFKLAIVATLALGSWPRQRLARLWAKRKPQNEGKSEGMNPHTPKWASILRVWSPKSLENNFRGQNLMDWRVPYIIKRLLKLICLK
jgi:hypothetical protein